MNLSNNTALGVGNTAPSSADTALGVAAPSSADTALGVGNTAPSVATSEIRQTSASNTMPSVTASEICGADETASEISFVGKTAATAPIVPTTPTNEIQPSAATADTTPNTATSEIPQTSASSGKAGAGDATSEISFVDKTTQTSASNDASAKLIIKNLSFSYGAKPVLSGVSLRLERGTIVAILGQSGVGKSTLFSLIAGLEHGSGYIHINQSPGELLRCAYMQQKDLLLGHLRVVDNIALPLRINGWSKSRAKHEAMGILSEFGMDELALAYPHELSGGLAKRVGLMRALCARASVYLLDEPFVGLDERSGRSVRAWFARVQRRLGLSAVFITHDIGEALELGDSVYVLSKNGTSWLHGSADDFADGGSCASSGSYSGLRASGGGFSDGFVGGCDGFAGDCADFANDGLCASSDDFASDDLCGAKLIPISKSELKTALINKFRLL